VQEWIDGIPKEKSSSSTRSDLEAVVKTIRMNMNERDPDQRVVQMFIKYHSILRQHNRQAFPKDHPKEAVEHLTSCLQPVELKTRVMNDLSLDRKDLRKDVLAFFTYCRAEAKTCERYVTTPGRSRQNQQPTTAVALVNSASPSGDTAAATRGYSREQTPKRRTEKAAPASNTQTPRLPPTCLNTVCPDRHFISECPRTSDAEKQVLRKAYIDKKEVRV
jgi:hypothetical protein